MINTKYNTPQARQTFGCKVIVDKEAQEILAKNMKRLHEIPQANDVFFNKSKTLNTDEKINYFKTTMETITNGVNGILHYKALDDKVILHYKTSEKTFQDPITYHAAEMLPVKNSKDSAKKQIATYNLARLSDMLSSHKVANDKNPFHKLYDFYKTF